MKRDTSNNLIMGMLILLAIFGALSLPFFLREEEVSEISQGEPVPDFCNIACGEYDYYSSNNNTRFNFIRCECVTGIEYSHREKFGVSDRPITKQRYFDSLSGLEINESVVVERTSFNKD